MALRWNLEDIKDSDQLCWLEATEDDPSHGIVKGESYMHPLTNVLIWATIAVDLPGITEENAREFFARLRFTERLDGPFLIRATDPETGKRPEGADAFITEEEVLAHVGLTANVTAKTRREWLKRFDNDLSRLASGFDRKKDALRAGEEEGRSPFQFAKEQNEA